MRTEQQSSSTSRIIRRFYGMRTIDALGSSVVVVNNLLFMQARGLSQLRITTWGAVYFLVTFVADIPTGVIADIAGRRGAYVVGCGLTASAFLTYYFGHSYLLFLLAAVVDAFGNRLRAGPIDAWAVDELDSLGFSKAKTGIFARSVQLQQIGTMTGVLIGAFAARADPAIPWLVGAAWQVAIAIAGGSLMTAERRPAAIASRLDIVALSARTISAVRQGLRNRSVLNLSIANGLTMAAMTPYFFQWPQYFNRAFRFGAQVPGLIFCGGSIAAILGSETVRGLPPESSRRSRLMTVIAGAQGLSLLVSGLSLSQPLLVLMLFLAGSVCAGLSMPIYAAWFNELIEGPTRATMLSFQSTFVTVGASVGLPTLGFVVDRAGLAVAWIVVGIVGIAAAPFYAMSAVAGSR